MIDEKFYRISHDLRILSSIRENNRIYTENAKMKIDSSYKPISAFSRYFNGEDRHKNIDIIQNLIDDSFFFIDTMLKLNFDQETNNEKGRIKSIISSIQILLIECTNGIRNLRITYQNDVSTKARLYDIEERIIRDLVSRNLFTDNSVYSKIYAIENRLAHGSIQK